ncbi:transposase [Arachidicoccus ginsenosidivorans]|uniref:Transposase n=1 Tax=Arachidicoccus ginsenosidivorans TaxID=496057 RepID=A0A5B8VID7_9BACT|nr:transposase [Arachidicoccus ginsenosidivorans]QEC70376.1 transposase [Arachidicoccus ginsenosidivorans]
MKAQYRATMFQVYKGKTAEKKKASVEDYLKKANELIEKTNGILYNNKLVLNSKAIVILIALRTFRDYAMTFTNQIDRRLLKGETIPSEEKRYSIFEPDTEWLTKGKANNKVELGHLFLVTTDQYQFIVDYKVMYDERDAAQVPSLVERLEKIYPNKDISSISFDKGFYSFENLETLEASKIKKIILPKKGKKNKEEKKKEAEAEFVKLRHKHSAVESNINMLEHHGLGKCMDKGVKGFNRYAGISVLAHNLHILGNLLEKQKQKPTRKRQKPAVREAA